MPSATLASQFDSLFIFKGLQKVGLVGAFINYHLKAHPLIHSIKVSEAPILIIGSGGSSVRYYDLLVMWF
jgi:hypothetical protein